MAVFQLLLMKSIRESIVAGKFPQFVNEFMLKMFPSRKFPLWAVDALSSVNIQLESAEDNDVKMTLDGDS